MLELKVEGVGGSDVLLQMILSNPSRKRTGRIDFEFYVRKTESTKLLKVFRKIVAFEMLPKGLLCNLSLSFFFVSFETAIHISCIQFTPRSVRTSTVKEER